MWSLAPLHPVTIINESATRLSRREWKWTFAAALLGTVVRCLLADRRGFWLDEFYTFYASTLTIPGLVAERLAAGHSPLPFLYTKIFYTLFGGNELGLKLSSILAGFAATFAVAGATGAMGLRRLLPILLPLLVVHPYWHLIATEFRYMMPLVAVAGFWLWASLAYLQTPTRQGFYLATLFGTLALWLHSSAIFILIGIVTIFVWHCFSGKIWRLGATTALRLFSPLFAAFALMLPLTVGFGLIEKQPGIASTPAIFKVINKQAEAFFADPSAAEALTHVKSGAVTVPATILFTICLVVAAMALRREGNAFAMRSLFGLMGGSALITMAYTLLKNDVQGPVRYVAFSSVPSVIIIALALADACRWRWRGLLLQVPVVLITLYCYCVQLLDQGDWHRESVRWLATNRKAAQPVIAVGRSMNLFAFQYYGVDQGGWVDGLSAEVRAKPVYKRMIRSALRHGDSVFFFHYRGRRRYDEVAETIESLQKTGEITYTRVWEPSNVIRITGLAKNARGAEELKVLPEIPLPVFGSSQF